MSPATSSRTRKRIFNTDHITDTDNELHNLSIPAIIEHHFGLPVPLFAIIGAPADYAYPTKPTYQTPFVHGMTFTSVVAPTRNINVNISISTKRK